MTPPKSAPNRAPEFKYAMSGRNDALKLARLAHENAQKSAGLWGEMSVGVIAREDTAFVHIWKGASLTDVFKLAAKRPKEISKPEHEALCAWLKSRRYEGFKHSISAWNVNAGEAERIKSEIISGLIAAGTKVINPAA